MSAAPAIDEVLVLHHSHTDIGYTHPQPVLWELERRFIDEAIDLCERTGDWPEPSRVRWTCETTTPLIRWLEQSSAKQVERFRALVKAGQIGAAAMPLNITPLYNSVQLAHSLQRAKRLREELGLPMRVAINHDVNGLPWPIVDLLRDAGVEMLVMGINVHFGGAPLHRPLAFRWKGPGGEGGKDAREILAFNGEHYQAFDRETKLRNGNLDEMVAGLNGYVQRLLHFKYPYDFVYLTATHHWFADNNPPNPRLAEMVRKWNDEGRTPRVRFILPEELLARVRKQPAETIPTYGGDWPDWWNFGSASSAAETRINRHAKTRLIAAQTLAALRPSDGDDTDRKRQTETFRRAWDAADLYDEHTWGIFCTVQNRNVDPVNEQWYHKGQLAYEARSLSGLLLRDQLDALAGGATRAGGTARGILVFNPTPVPRRDFVRIPRSVADGHFELFSSHVLQIDVHRDLYDDGNSILIGPVELPAFGWRSLELAELKPAAAAKDLAASDHCIESPHYRLCFNRETGRVESLFDKRIDVELLDGASEWPFFGFVRETPDPQKQAMNTGELGRESLYLFAYPGPQAGPTPWRTEWSAIRQGPTKLKSATTHIAADGVTLALAWEAPGVEDLHQRITLSAHRPAIRMSASFNKLDVRTPEGIYFTFPLDLPNWRAHYDTADVPVEFDREQLPGSLRDYVTVGRWASIGNDRAAVTLACPDAPMVMFGGFNFARLHKPQMTDKPLLLAWPMNNYWNTNFRVSQPGYVRFDYALTSGARADAVASSRFGLEETGPFEWHPICAQTAEREGRLLELEGEGALVLSATRESAYTVNATSEAVRAQLRIGERHIEFTLPPRGVRTVSLV